ncbi:MAG: twin-arginine translocation signal domain-containing protein, partial [Xanthomonadales bacterium]|nr:twin-arginine translocation signal domain-containing protein [Xanthomonadales bacterium]
MNRRQFVHGATAACGLAAAGKTTLGLAWQGKADLVLTGGTFYTMDPGLGPVEALAVRGDRILAVGSVDEITALSGPGTEIIDTRGMTITPGFIDAHSHPLSSNEAVSVDVDFRTIPEV